MMRFLATPGDNVGKPWKEDDATIEKMIGEGASVREIAAVLPHRTFQAVEKRISRRGLKAEESRRQTKISFSEIRAERIIEREEALKILAGAIEKLQKGGEMEEAELIRFRTIIMAIRGYFSAFESFEKYAELEARLNRLAEAMGVDLEKDSENSAIQDHQNDERQG
jgi:hypothetical protein